MKLFLTGVLMACFLGLSHGVASAADVQPIVFQRETLPNGLKVIYAPMDNAPVVHVRVLYHVGSRDERDDRNGFAHMFEHMMFRGSAHVASEQHMSLINSVGGMSNAFTSFDQTTYVNTVPTNHLEMALWLEADRMASFKVSEPVFVTERGVVKEEWRMRYANQPYGPMSQDMFGLAFTQHHYRWTPIGDMDQLARSTTQELQDFHDRYYVPNNACLIVAGQFDIDQARQWIRQFYEWIPAGPKIERETPAEPEQTEYREKTVYREQVPLPRVSMAWKSPAYGSDDHLAIELITNIMGAGRSSRLYQSLVAGDDPLAADASMGNYQLEDPSIIVGQIGLLPGKDADAAIRRFLEQVDRFVNEGATNEEFDKAKTMLRVDLIQARQTAESIARLLGEEEVFGGDAARVNSIFDKLEKLTVEDLKTVAAKYLKKDALSVVKYLPGTDPHAGNETSTSKPDSSDEPVTDQAGPADTTSNVAVSSRKIEFPADFPTTAPQSNEVIRKAFNKGVVSEVSGVQVITLTDKRLPVVNVTLVMRNGGYAVPAGKTGLAGLTASLLTRGAGGMTAQQFADDIESRGISINVNDDGDVTRATAYSLVDQLDHAVDRLGLVLKQPDFPENEFSRLQRQLYTRLMQQLSDPGSVADREFDRGIYENSPLGRNTTLESIQAITRDDVTNWYKSNYTLKDAVLVFAGDIEQPRALELAAKFLDGIPTGQRANVDYSLPEIPARRHIILVDNPTGAQAAIRAGIQTYDLSNQDRFAGSVAGQILSAGIDSRLNKVLRAEKGLTYGSYGFFRPNRHGGAFELNIDTKPETTGEAIKSAFEVFETMQTGPVTEDEINTAKSRVAGLMVLETQTIQQQAGRRVDTILNGYPIDYYDNYPSLIAATTIDQVQNVMNKYLHLDRMTIIVVAPESVKSQLEELGDVTVVKMPLADMQMPGAGPKPTP